MKKIRFYTISAIMFVMIIFTVIMSSSLKTNAKENPNNKKIYTSIIINSGDTLWDIANEYKPDDMSSKEYIKEIKEINSLSSDNIHSGNYLMIYYVER